MNRSVIILSIIIVSLNDLFAQNPITERVSYGVISKRIENELLDKATKEIERKEIDEANRNFSTLNYYELLKNDPSNSKNNYAYALSLYSNFQQPKSIPYFERAILNSKDTIVEAYYFLANSFHLSGKYDEATHNYKIYLSLLDRHHSFLPKEELEYAKKDISHRIEMCENGKLLSLSTSKSPEIKEGKRIMLSSVGSDINAYSDDFGSVFSANDSKLYFTSKRNGDADIYFSQFENNKWSPVENIGWPINTGSYEAVINLSPDGKRIYFYRSGLQDGNVYYSDFTNNHWNFPQPLLANSETDKALKDTRIYSFALTDAKDELFVVSDRKGGLGGKDIYVSKKLADSTWGPLENLRAPINTEYDEAALSLSADGNTMYFSSNGDKSIGGYDVFVSNRKDGHWSEPMNLGVPINTPGDDLFFSFLNNGSRASYSTSANAADNTRDLDIFFVDFCDIVTKNTIKGIALGVSSGTITITDAVQKNDITRCNIKDGKYSVDLKVGRRYDFTFETRGIQPVHTVLTVPDPSECKRYDIYQEIAFTKPGDTMRIKSALFDIEYEKKHPDISTYPALLKAADKKLLINYIENNLPTYPSESITITSVVYDTISGKVLSKVTFNNTLFDSDKNKVKKIYGDLKTSSGSVKTYTTLSFSNLLFDFDKSKLEDFFKKELDKVAEYLTLSAPDSEIAIAGCADSEAATEHNQTLSKCRAESIAAYLKSKKINEKRITLINYGDIKPVVSNNNL